jgi:hypothetical protein
MAFPTPYTATRYPYAAGETDALGNAIDSWGEAQSIPVYGWAPPSADQMPSEQNRSAVVRDMDLLAPASVESTPRDHWVLPGIPPTDCPQHPGAACFEQVGYAEDFTHGPFGWDAGLRINLKRVEG